MGLAHRPSLTLCYHAIDPDWPSALAVTPEQLRAQLASLLRQGYRGVTFAEAVFGDGPDKALAVTFDDGFASVHASAFPILASLGLPGTVFVPTSFVGQAAPLSWAGIDHWKGTTYQDRLQCMSWSQLRELCEAGWEIASHTRTHRVLTQLGDQELKAELSESRQACAHEVGTPCVSLAYPYGTHDQRVRTAARQAGYTAAATFQVGKEGPLQWPRVGILPSDGSLRFRIKTSAAVRRILASAAGRLLRRLPRPGVAKDW